VAVPAAGVPAVGEVLIHRRARAKEGRAAPDEARNRQCMLREAAVLLVQRLRNGEVLKHLPREGLKKSEGCCSKPCAEPSWCQRLL
jgi:hypothetical protein